MSSMYPCGRHRPDLKIVWSHEYIRNSYAHGTHDMVIEGLGLGVGHAPLERCVDQAIHTSDLLFLGQHGDIVLKWVWDP